MRGGYHEEAMAWRDWLLRAVAGNTSEIQIMYGPAGERRLDEWEVDWLSGYEGSKPGRIGNAAAGQYQLDVYGEVMSALYQAARAGDMNSGPAWDLQKALMNFLETGWSEPDDGIWEVRGPRRHFTHSKVMAWVAVDRAVRSVEEFGPRRAGRPVEGDFATRSTPRCCEKGYNARGRSLHPVLRLGRSRREPVDDPAVRLPSGDRSPGAFDHREDREGSDRGRVRPPLPRRGGRRCRRPRPVAKGRSWPARSGWRTVSRFIGRTDDARALFERLVGLRNDLGPALRGVRRRRATASRATFRRRSHTCRS